MDIRQVAVESRWPLGQLIVRRRQQCQSKSSSLNLKVISFPNAKRYKKSSLRSVSNSSAWSISFHAKRRRWKLASQKLLSRNCWYSSSGIATARRTCTASRTPGAGTCACANRVCRKTTFSSTLCKGDNCMPTDTKICFVIMPFSKTIRHTRKHWTCHFEKFLKPLIEENPNVRAQCSEAKRGDILEDIIKHLVLDPIVVADLTDWNPNVFWELGVRQSFHNPTITIAEKGTKLPFDVGRKGTHFYRPFKPKAEGFVEKFKEAIQDCLDRPGIPDSPVYEAISGRGTFFEIFRREEAKRRLDAVLSEIDKNLEILGIIERGALENQKKLEGFNVSPDHLALSALEFVLKVSI